MQPGTGILREIAVQAGPGTSHLRILRAALLLPHRFGSPARAEEENRPKNTTCSVQRLPLHPKSRGGSSVDAEFRCWNSSVRSTRGQS